MRDILLGIIFGLFAVCFLAIIVEETFLGGRRRRRAEKAARGRKQTGLTVPASGEDD